MTSEETEQLYSVTQSAVADGVTQLMSVPRLGLEHAAYRIETDLGPVWIDSPSAFNRDIEPVDAILFTHKDFMGASNQYRELWGQVYIHQLDAAHPLARQFPVGNAFSGDFERGSLEAYHIGGHTPGFTMYIHGDVLLPGRALARAPLGGGFPASSFRFARWVHTSTLDHVSSRPP